MKNNIQDINQNDSSLAQKSNKEISQNKKENINCNIQINNYQPQNIDQIFINEEKPNNTNVLTKEEIIKAKENSFILLGKTGVGKTSLLNVIYGKDIGKVGYTSLSETNESKYYCIKEKIDNKNIYFCIIDTPGLCDTGGKEIDEKQKKEIMQLISKENIKIKGLLFLSNFQNERFDASEQNTLIDYIKIFPLKDFWKRIIFIFTHYYGDPNSFSKEEIKENNNIFKSKILKKLMNRVKDVTTPVQFKDLNCRYINVYTKNLNELRIKNNLEIKKEITSEIIKYTQLKPMFSKLQIFNFENYEIEKNDKYLYNCDLYIYLDSNDKIIHQEFHILKRIPKNVEKNKEHKVQLNIEDCEMNKEGNLIKKTTKKEGFEEIFKNYKGEIGGGLTILSLIGVICSGILFPAILPIPLISMGTGAYLWNKNRVEKEEDRKKTEEIIVNEKIIELIKNELKKINK